MHSKYGRKKKNENPRLFLAKKKKMFKQNVNLKIKASNCKLLINFVACN